MHEVLNYLWDEVNGRIEGPVSLRLIIQPVIAAGLAAYAGLRDARENKSPFLWSVVFRPDERADLLKQSWKEICKVFVAALVLDVVYQFVSGQSARLIEAIPAAVILALVPYLLVRGPVTRIAELRR